MAMSSATCDIVWLKQLADEIDTKIAPKIKLYCDNQSTIKLAESDAFRPRTKHIDIRYHYIRDKISENVIEVKFIATGLMTADSLTKAVSKEKTEFCRKSMGLVQSRVLSV